MTSANANELPEAARPVVSTSTGAWDGARWQVRSSEASVSVEMIIGGDKVYVRSAVSDEELGDQRWVLSDEDASTGEGGVDVVDYRLADFEGASTRAREALALNVAQSLYLGGSQEGLTAAPDAFLAAIGDLAEVRVVDEADGITTPAAIGEAPGEVEERFGGPLPDARFELDIAADDRPVALRLDLVAGTSSSSMEMKLTDWGEPVDIPVPSADDVDATPLTDATGFDLHELTVVWPPDMPNDQWFLVVRSPEGTAERGLVEGDCEAVELDWSTVTVFDSSHHFRLYQRPLSCALEVDPTPFRSGGPGGLPSRPADWYGGVEVQVGATAIALDTNLTGTDLDVLALSLTPVDIDTLLSTAVAADLQG